MRETYLQVSEIQEQIFSELDPRAVEVGQQVHGDIQAGKTLLEKCLKEYTGDEKFSLTPDALITLTLDDQFLRDLFIYIVLDFTFFRKYFEYVYEWLLPLGEKEIIVRLIDYVTDQKATWTLFNDHYFRNLFHRFATQKQEWEMFCLQNEKSRYDIFAHSGGCRCELCGPINCSDLLQKYAQKVGYVLKDREVGVSQNVAIGCSRLAEKDYDLVVGVVHAGVSPALLMEALGKNTRYLEYHRKIPKPPSWQKFGRNVETPVSAQNILVCENDVVTGSTLQAIQPVLADLGPQKVDLFTWSAKTAKPPVIPVEGREQFYTRHHKIGQFYSLRENQDVQKIREKIQAQLKCKF